MPRQGPTGPHGQGGWRVGRGGGAHLRGRWRCAASPGSRPTLHAAGWTAQTPTAEGKREEGGSEGTRAGAAGLLLAGAACRLHLALPQVHTTRQPGWAPPVGAAPEPRSAHTGARGASGDGGCCAPGRALRRARLCGSRRPSACGCPLRGTGSPAPPPGPGSPRRETSPLPTARVRPGGPEGSGARPGAARRRRGCVHMHAAQQAHAIPAPRRAAPASRPTPPAIRWWP